MSIGYHCIWDVFGCTAEDISYVDRIKSYLNELVDTIHLSKISESYKQFEPVGVTGFILLEESHISIHTWPENNFVAIDVFSCKKFDENKLTDKINELFKTNDISLHIVERGNKVTSASFA